MRDGVRVLISSLLFYILSKSMSHTFCELKFYFLYVYNDFVLLNLDREIKWKNHFAYFDNSVLIVLYFSWKLIVSIKYVYYVKLKIINHIFSDFSEEISNSKHVQSNLSNMLVIICIYQTKTTGSVANQHFKYFGKIASIKCKLIKILRSLSIFSPTIKYSELPKFCI